MAKRAQTVAKTADEARLAIEEFARDIVENMKAELPDEESAEDIRQHAAGLAAAVKDTGREYAGRAREKGEEVAARARAGAEHLYEAGHQKANEAAHYAGERYDDFSELVRRNPGKSLGIAAGIGFIVGLIATRR